ncbi:hypothetical protein H0H93_002872 [Arthromyces matolae]|nr:hypothetical protein H0H93_002872 [Arthromyces matolae]
MELEYIVDESHAAEVLTNDVLFSAEQGTAARHMFDLASQAGNAHTPHPVDLASSVHEAMAESMLLLIVGEKNPDRELIDAAIKVAFHVATVSGIYQNIGYWSRTFPTTWRIFIWIKIMILTIPWTYRKIALRIWKDFKQARQTGSTDHMDPDCLTYHLIKESGNIPGVLQSLWFICLTLGLFFASIHQTSAVIVWVIYEMAVRRETLPALREELSNILEIDCESGKPSITYNSLRNAEVLDSFIREVFRMKGDTLSVIRLTTDDVPLGGYIIPKGSFVIPLATLSHENTKSWGENAGTFVGDRWVGTDKTAASISTAYWPFGLGRFACPGRFLAVAEIKLMVLNLISRVDVSLEGAIAVPVHITDNPPTSLSSQGSSVINHVSNRLPTTDALAPKPASGDLIPRGGGGLADVAVQVVKGIGKLISKIIDLVKARRKRNREHKIMKQFTESVVDEGRKQKPEYNWVISSTPHEAHFEGTEGEGKDWNHETKVLEVDGKSITYDVYYGKAGTFTSKGGKNPQDWTYKGSYSVDKKSKGKQVIFRAPN